MNFIWIAYDYLYDGPEGTGTAYAFSKDGKLFEKNLGHCSCNYATDGEWEEIKIAPFLEEETALDSKLDKAVKQLLS